MREEMYIDILRCKDVVTRNAPQKWFLLHDNAPAQRRVLVKALYAKNVTMLELPPYSPDLAPVGFYLLPQPQSELKGAALS
jgi:hypothetical protein